LELLALAPSLQPEALNEFLSVASPADLHDHGTRLLEFVQEASSTARPLDKLVRLRSFVQQDSTLVRGKCMPWDQGYELARQLRSVLAHDLKSPNASVSEFMQSLEIDSIVKNERALR